MREIYDVVIAIEGRAAALLAQMPEAARELAALELAAHTEAMSAASETGDPAGWGHADECFHRTLVERAGNGRMIRINQTITDQAHRARMLTLKLRANWERRWRNTSRSSRRSAPGDAAAAQEQAYRHRSHTRNELLPLLESFGLKHL